MKKCLICGEEYSNPLAISRTNNKVEICSMCSLREAIDEFNKSIRKNEVYTVYSEEADITFIMEDNNNKSTVAIFYYGESDNVLTKQYYGKLFAEYED